MQNELRKLIKRIDSYSSSISEKSIKKAFEFSSRAYGDHKRLNGDSVMRHAIETAKILTNLKVDEETIISALLHEVPEYTSYTVHEISKKFGKNVGVLVSAFEKISSVKVTNDRREIESLRKMFLVMARDLRVVLIKLADRLHNLQTLDVHPRGKQKKIARETLEIFVPIASRLGVYEIRSTLEDLCFKFLYPDEYNIIQEQLKDLGKKRKNAIRYIQNDVEDFLKSLNIEGRISGRYKNTYSIYKKLKRKGKSSVSDIQDIYALRIIIPTVFDESGNEDVSALYHLIGLFHNKWKPLPGRFKDYIGFPKPNGYRSLHTTVIGLAPHSLKEPVEIQIRTQKMHEEAEYGIAAHWLYKETKNSIPEKQRAHMEWIQHLAKMSKKMEGDTQNEVMSELKFDLFQDRIFVYTPKGEVRDLPAGSTPVDFAYSVHTDVGNKCVMAKANGNIVSLDYELQNGDVIEILTRTESEPKLQWLTFVKTSGARMKIKNYFRALNKDEHYREGKRLINEKLIQLGKQKLDPKLSVLREYDGKKLTLKEREEILRMVGNGSMLSSAVIRKVFTQDDLMGEDDIKKPGILPAYKKITESEIGKHISVGGEKGLAVKIAKCCKPSFGQPIAGYITRGRAISIHKKNCRVFKASNPERRIETKWIGIPDEEFKNVNLVIETTPDAKIMRDVTNVVSKYKGNILHFYISGKTPVKLIWDIAIEVNNFDELETILDKISSIKGIKSVRKAA
jgi:GTP pyrophosphokinase